MHRFAALVDVAGVAALALALNDRFGAWIPAPWWVAVALAAWWMLPVRILGRSPGMVLCKLQLSGDLSYRSPLDDVDVRAVLRGSGRYSRLFLALAGMAVAVYTLVVGAGRCFLALVLGGAFGLEVLPRQPLPEGEDEASMALDERRRRRRGLFVAEAAAVLLGVGVPYLFLIRPFTRGAGVEDRLWVSQQRAAFEKDPSDAFAAERFASALDDPAAAAVRARHESAVKAKNTARERSLRERLAKNPDDATSIEWLADYLSEVEREREARALYEEWIRRDPLPVRQAAFGVWLWQQGHPAEAVAWLNQGGELTPEQLGVKGLAYRDLGKRPEARAALEEALRRDPKLQTLRKNLEALTP